MANLSVKLWNALQQLKEDEFKRFKWLLKQDDMLEGHSGLSVAQLETADRQDTVDLMAQKYGCPGALKESMNVLEKISRNDLVQRLQNSCPDPKDSGEACERQQAELKGSQQFAVAETLDPDPALPALCRSGDGKQVQKKLPDTVGRFYRCVCWERINQQEGINHSES